MKKLIFPALALIFGFFILSVTAVSAKVMSNENGTITVAKDEVVNDDLFINAQTVEIEGGVNGDVFIAAQTVRINGTINGTLHVASQTVSLNGYVKGNAYIGAQDFTSTGGNIGGSLFTGAQSISMDKDTVVAGSLFAGAATLKVDSQVKRNVFAGTGMLTVGDNAVIGKDLYVASGDEGQANISEKAKIAGTINKSQPFISDNEIKKLEPKIPKLFRAVSAVGTLLSFFGALLIGFLYLKFFEKHFTGASNLVANSFWKSIGVGFLIIVALVPALIILLITMVGIPLAGLSFLIFLLFSYMAKIVVGSTLGVWLAKRFSWKLTPYKAFALGLFAIYVVKMIPVIGPLTGFMIFLPGLGALTLQTFAKAK